MKSAVLGLLLGLPLLAAPRAGVFEAYDGNSPFIDQDFVVAGQFIEASWSNYGAEEYRWAIGTTPGGEEIQPLTSVATATVAVSSAAAVAGTLYFVTVKGYNSGLEFISDVSDGITGIDSPAASAVPVSGTAPLTVNFLCQLQGVALYEWDFDVPFLGAGKRSARSVTPPSGAASVDYSSPSSGNASFTYTFAGSFEARLKLHHQGGDIHTASLFIDVSPAPDAPSVGVSADTTAGPAPLTVTFSSAVSAQVGAYFWDFNQDGVFDASTDVPTLTHTFTSPGFYDVSSTVFNADGVGSSSSTLQIDVQPPLAGDVPTVTAASAVGGPFRVGDLVPFTAGGAAGTGTITGFHWDFDGNGEVDLITPTGSATWQFSAPGNYNGTVSVSDSENLSSSPSGIPVTIDLALGQDRVWLVEPVSGLKIFGNFVTLTANAIPADQVTGVDFFYRTAGTTGPWLPINATPVLPPPATEFGTHWDVTGLPQGAPGFDLLARASFAGRGSVDSTLIQTVTVQVDAAAPDLLENSGSPFTKLKVQGVNPNASANVGISRDTTLALQTGSTFGYDQMRVERRSENPHPVESTLQGLRFVPGHFRKKSFASGQKLKKPSKVTMYLNTGGSDILADGTDLNTSTFQIMKFNEKDLRWEPLFNQTFNPSQKLIKAFSATTGDVAIAVVSNRAASSSSSASCGLLGVEILLAGLAAAGLARLVRRRA
ncbi:MAG TPA: PKD domain-containing protein [Planctomycetota bacterium]